MVVKCLGASRLIISIWDKRKLVASNVKLSTYSGAFLKTDPPMSVQPLYNPLHANAESLVKGRSHDTVSMETHTPPS